MKTAELVCVVADPLASPEGLGAVAGRLGWHGLPLRGRRTVPADESTTVAVLRQAAAGGGLVVAIGDDEGAAALRGALARLTGGRLVLSDRALEALSAAFAVRERPLPGRAEGRALVPQGATVLVAAEGGEPGLLADVDGSPVAVLPASPVTALALLEEHVLPRLSRREGEVVEVVRVLRAVAAEPGPVEVAVGDAVRDHEGVSVHLAPHAGELTIRLRIRAGSLGEAQGRWPLLEPGLKAALGAACFGEEDVTLEGAVGERLRDRGLTVALAESCTGGLVGHRLTQVSGSSAYVDRGFVVYSNAAKEALLGVPARVLREHGAVSRPCAEAMARGARERAGTDLGLAVTGIAGPGGGTPTKPVGTVFVGLADRAGAWVGGYRFREDRGGNKALAATMALDALRRYALGGLASLPG